MDPFVFLYTQSTLQYSICTANIFGYFLPSTLAYHQFFYFLLCLLHITNTYHIFSSFPSCISCVLLFIVSFPLMHITCPSLYCLLSSLAYHLSFSSSSPFLSCIMHITYTLLFSPFPLAYHQYLSFIFFLPFLYIICTSLYCLLSSLAYLSCISPVLLFIVSFSLLPINCPYLYCLRSLLHITCPSL